MSLPMLAATVRSPEDIHSYPLLVTPKIDGVRAMIVNGVLVSRTLRPIPNKRIRAILEPMLPEGTDGEIFCNDLHTTTSVAMSFNVESEFRFFWFDWAYDANVPYKRRVLSVQEYMFAHNINKNYIVPLLPHYVHNLRELLSYEEESLSNGYEGIVLRVPDGRYKRGRSTLKEGFMMKLKRFTDSEATITGVEELVHGAGPLAGCRGNTLGSIVARAQDGTVFRIGTGYTASQRQELWASRNDIVGKAVKYRHGSEAVNRSPVFVGIRHHDDI